MADAAFVLIILVLFTFAALFVRFCDRVVGTADDEQ